MSVGQNTASQTFPLNRTLINPGLLAGGGINQSVSRFSIPELAAWTIENLEPVRRGWTNKGIGWKRLNTNRPVISKVQCCFVFDSKICFVADGNFYTMPVAGGVVSLATAGGASAFDSSARVRYAYNRGSTVDKVYLCDGVSDGKYWDGSTLADVTDLLTVTGYTVPDKIYTWRGRTVWGFKAGSVNENRLVISKVSDGDDYDFTATSALDALDTEVSPGDGDYINGIGSIKIKGNTDQTEVLVACKTKQAFQADDISFASSTVSAVFNRIGVDIECLNPDCVISFLNDLWIMGRTGIKGFTAVAGQDGISSLVQSASLPVDNLIINSSQSSAFSNAFIQHFSELRKIWIFLPRNSATSASQNNFVYPEVPNDYAICYAYGITNTGGNIINSWYSRGGPGWAVSSACANEDEIIVGSYFGDIYQVTPGFGDNDYEPEVSAYAGTYYDTSGNVVSSPTIAQINQPVFSTFETGDWIFDNFNQEKRLEEIRAWFFAERQTKINFTIYYNGEETGISYLNKISRQGNASSVGLWDIGLWDVSLWAGELWTFCRVKPSGHGRSVRIKLDFYNKLENSEATNYNTNYITLTGLSGRIQLGGDYID